MGYTMLLVLLLLLTVFSCWRLPQRKSETEMQRNMEHGTSSEYPACIGKKRLAFVQKYSSWTLDEWRRVLWTDEATFRVSDTKGKKVWRRKGSDPHDPKFTASSVKHPPPSWRGRTALRATPRTSSKNGLFQAKWNAFQTGQLTARTCHPSKICGDIVKCKLRNEDTSTLPKLECALRRAWSSVSQETVEKLADSLPSRLMEVSWVRGSDIRLLTTGSITYTSDSRFVAVNPSKGEQWILKIHYVRKSDAGSYLCQVSTTPPITLTVNLTVQVLFGASQRNRRKSSLWTNCFVQPGPTEAVATVLPGREVFVKSGSRLEIVCQVEGCPPPALLAWTRGRQTVNSPESNNYDLVKSNSTIPMSRLILARPHATSSDSGNYSCTSTCTRPINVTVHVLRGEELAAMQHHNTSRSLHPSSLLVLLIQAVLLLDAHYNLGRRHREQPRLLPRAMVTTPSPHRPTFT
ncbi:hypothetical protein O3P69_003790 [Scylla paramamosain]|uniref:Ig-like domain-containing protein n=1 Tax=Scylla paramamosain TaxID=85552 RepID=A0AAW0UFV8_SCYPA